MTETPFFDESLVGWWKEGLNKIPAHRLFSRLLLKSLIMSERKSRRTSISSALGAEFFNKVATTLRITEIAWTETHAYRTRWCSRGTKLNSANETLTWVLNLDSGVGLRMRFVNYLCARLLRQYLACGAVTRHQSHLVHTETRCAATSKHLRRKCFVTSYRVL